MTTDNKQDYSDLPPPSHFHPMSGEPIWDQHAVRAALSNKEMTVDNKQFELTDDEIRALSNSVFEEPISGLGTFARNVEQAVLSKLRGAGEPSDDEIKDLAATFQLRDTAFCVGGPGQVIGFARALLARYALTSGHSTQSPDTSSGHSEPVAEVQLHPHDASKAIVVALVDFEVVDVGMQLYDAPQASAEESDRESADQWRRLALQFDGHRMQAIGWLKAALAELPDIPAWSAARAFLAAPPLSGEQVLAERIRVLADRQQRGGDSLQNLATEKFASDKEREAFDRWFYLAPTKIPPETFTDDFYGIALEVWRSALASQKPVEGDDLALHVINSARAALDASTEANDDDMSLLVPSHLHAALSLAVDEYDAAIAQQGKEG